EAIDFSRALDHGPGDEVADGDCAIEEYTVEAVSDEPPGESAEKRRTHTKSEAIHEVRLEGVVIHGRLIELVPQPFLAGGAAVNRQAILQDQIRRGLAIFTLAIEARGQ